MPFVGSIEGKMAFGRPTATSSNVVTSNLQVWLDSGNNSPYAGSGTTWTNLVSSNAPAYNFTLTNFAGATTSNITYNGTTNRAITFDGNDDYAVNNTSLISLVRANAWDETREYWVYWPGTGGCLTQETGVNTPYGGWHDAQTSLSSTNLVFSVWQGNVSMTPYVTTSSLAANRWNHIVFQYNSTSGGGGGTYTGTLTAFLNGAQVYSNAAVSRTTPDSAPGTGFFLLLCQGDNVTNFGYNSATNLAASIAIFRWYNTILSPSQVLQNYNANKARFGLT
jgi:hypothetical protein